MWRVVVWYRDRVLSYRFRTEAAARQLAEAWGISARGKVEVAFCPR